jgi:hypothetical protein
VATVTQRERFRRSGEMSFGERLDPQGGHLPVR